MIKKLRLPELRWLGRFDVPHPRYPRHTGGSIMNRLTMADVRVALRAGGLEKRRMVDRVFAIAFVLAVFAVEVAVVQFAGPQPPVPLDGETYVLPIT